MTKTIDAELRKNIVDTEITITAKSSLGICGQDVEQIERKVFFLSLTEIGMKGLSTACNECKTLKYFKDDYRRRIAYNSTGASSWTLRTSATSNVITVWGVGPDGTMGEGTTYYESGISPAFCLPRDVTVYKDTLDGETVYIIPKGTTQESL